MPINCNFIGSFICEQDALIGRSLSLIVLSFVFSAFDSLLFSHKCIISGIHEMFLAILKNFCPADIIARFIARLWQRGIVERYFNSYRIDLHCGGVFELFE